MKILVLNAGSSSLKSALYDLADPVPENPPEPLWEGKIEWGSAPEFRVRNDHGEVSSGVVRARSHREATERLLDLLWKSRTQVIHGPAGIEVVGYRVVHGGKQYIKPTIVTPEVKAGIARLAEFAPLHNPAALEGIDLIEAKLVSVPQVAIFDTAFHAQLPLPAAAYPGPHEWLEQGIRRYGFHGINHQYCAGRAAQILSRGLNSMRLIVCHLGNGCSLAAIERGRSVETTMGFTPLEGLVMGTRSGSVDPGILTYLLRRDGLTADDLDGILNKKSGLLGVSGVSGDMREIISAMDAGNSRAKLAFDIYVHRLKYYIGAMAAVLGGVDALVFTAGVGENCAQLRAAACEKLGFLGLELDPKKNFQPSSERDRDISTTESWVRVLIIRAQEDWAIARACWKTIHAQKG